MSGCCWSALNGMLLARYFFHRLVLLSLLVSLGMGGLLARNLWAMHQNLLDNAERASRNLSHTLAVGLEWVLADVDRDVLQMRSTLQNDGLQGIDAQAMLAVSGSALLLLDAQGRGVRDMAFGQEQIDLVQRDFFQALQRQPDMGLAIGVPQVLVQDSPQVLPLARAWQQADGRLGGVIVAFVPLQRLQQWVSGMHMAPGSAINLIRMDGQVLLRFPALSALPRAHTLAGSENLRRYTASQAGVFTRPSVLDGIERIHSFEHVTAMPLLVNVVQARDAVLAPWRSSAWTLGGIALLLFLGNLGLALLFVRELERRRRTQKALQVEKDRMQEMALHDPLTGLPNRTLLQDRIEHAIAAAQREAGAIGLLYLDLDGFKEVNDRWGHAAGDHVLVHIARQLQQVARMSDTVCRLGGDEFVLLLPGCTLVDVREVIIRVLQACATPCWWHGENLQAVYGVSGGVSIYPEHGTSFAELLRHADTALYQAKEAGRGQVYYFQAVPSY